MKTYNRIFNMYAVLCIGAAIAHPIFRLHFSWWLFVPAWLVIPVTTWLYVWFLSIQTRKKQAELAQLLYDNPNVVVIRA